MRRGTPVVVAAGLAAMAIVSCGGSSPAPVAQQDVAAVAGWTRMATTSDYMIVVNVLPGERMFTPTELQAEHPTEGEQILDGKGLPLGTNVRHVEAHVYDRRTGLPLSDVHPQITLTNLTTGERTAVVPTLMQDIIIGKLDIHFGNNIVVTGGSDLSLHVDVNGEEVTVDGHLD